MASIIGEPFWMEPVESTSTAITVFAAGDFDGDGYDDLYVCQPAGLPNRLYRNRGDGTFVDVTEKAGVGLLDGTSAALFADLTNNGRQDLIVVRTQRSVAFYQPWRRYV